MRLTSEQQLERAKAEYAKAVQLLSEAKITAKRGDTPASTVHAAYYAMHHCANAVLLTMGGVDKFGDVPKSHEHVIEHFSKKVAALDDAVAQLRPALARARLDRAAADYDLAVVLTAQMARDLVAQAESS